MVERLLVGVLGNRNSGKSTTWNTIFGRTVRTGSYPRWLNVNSSQSVEVFVISGSPQERELDVSDILSDTECRIVLCSLQYTERVSDSLDYFSKQSFSMYVQWLNPGYYDHSVNLDRHGLVNRLLAMGGIVAMRDGKADPESRVQELRDYISGWAAHRDLLSNRASL